METTVEFPHGSGVRAVYSPAEKALMRGLVAEADAGRIETGQALREIGVLHDLKVLLDARLIADDPVEEPADQLELG